IYQIGLSFVTRSSYFVEAGLLEKLGGRLMRKVELMDEWEKACLQFINRIRDYYPSDKIILHKAYFANEYINSEGATSNFDERKSKIYQSINKLLEHYYRFFETNLPGIKVIELERNSYYAWENHEWGLAPMHYENSYYARILEKIDEVTNTK